MANESKQRAANYMSLKGALEPKDAKNMKQTATEWLFEQLWETSKDKLNWYAILYDAKELEKEQIKGAYEEGEDNIDLDGCQIDKKGSEKYYNEQYEK
jgi:hypothetical protein